MIFNYKTMETKPWNCCRTCLCEQTLYPIFPLSEYNEKYSDVIFTATGQKIELNDSLPQEMCSPCITFINQSYKFRKKCEETQNQLRSRLDNGKFQNIKVETSQIKQEATSIDISEFLHDDDDFKDYDDNITLNSLQYFVPDKLDTEQSKEIQHIEVLFNSKKSKNVSNKEEKPKRKLRSKKENKEVGKKERKGKKGDRERVKEEIECEYCHKILTSKLSLRNHNKIHTGFDVVCEHCGKKFITRRLLLMHCRAKHGYEKTDKCSFCDYRASNAEQVKIHERLHTGEKPYVCKECGAGFHRKSSYLQHVAIHLPEKTVQCDQCPARFKSVTLMRIHKNRHRAPQYSFKCRVCDNSFARRRNVARHLQRIHGLPPDLQHIDRLKIG